MFYSTPIAQTKVLVAHRVTHNLSDEARARLPTATPSRGTRRASPKLQLPTGNVVIDDPEELRVWSLVATPVRASKVSRYDGGYLQYVTGDPRKPVLYFKFHASSERVYGQAVPYLRRRHHH